MSELDREMLRHLKAYRSETRPSAPQRDRMLQGLLGRVRDGDDVDLEPTPIPAAPRLRWAIAAAVVVGLLGGAAWLVERPVPGREAVLPSSAALYGGDVQPVPHELVPSEPQATAPPRRQPQPLAPAPLEDLRPVPASTPVLTPAAGPIAPRERPVRRRPAPVVEPSIDAAEVTLLRRAQAALEGAPAQALDLLVDHAQSYPRSSLAAEREIARATALCNLGRIDEARARAESFEAKHPSSPLLPRMRRICNESH